MGKKKSSDEEMIQRLRSQRGRLQQRVATLEAQLTDRGSADKSRLMTSAEVCAKTCISVRTLWRMVADGRFPQPIRYNRKLVRWRAADVEAHINGDGVHERPNEADSGIGNVSARNNGGSALAGL